MTMHSGRFQIVAFAAVFLLLAATERGAQAQNEWVNALRQGGYVDSGHLDELIK
jgi:spermidine/putrescine-binding protein